MYGLTNGGLTLRKQKKIVVLTIAFLLAIAITLTCFYLIPIGKRVRVTASVTPREVNINGCSLSEVYLLDFNNPESSESDGNRLIMLSVFSSQAELFTIEKANVTSLIGSYVIDTPALPADVRTNSELSITVQLKDSAGNLLAEDKTTMLYK
jgi:hypothetical protein